MRIADKQHQQQQQQALFDSGSEQDDDDADLGIGSDDDFADQGLSDMTDSEGEGEEGGSEEEGTGDIRLLQGPSLCDTAVLGRGSLAKRHRDYDQHLKALTQFPGENLCGRACSSLSLHSSIAHCPLATSQGFRKKRHLLSANAQSLTLVAGRLNSLCKWDSPPRRGASRVSTVQHLLILDG